VGALQALHLEDEDPRCSRKQLFSVGHALTAGERAQAQARDPELDGCLYITSSSPSPSPSPSPSAATIQHFFEFVEALGQRPHALRLAARWFGVGLGLGLGLGLE